METIQRRPIVYILTKQQQKWLDTNCCPICGLPKKRWKRRTDWRCCSTDCTEEFSEVVVFIWQYFKVKAFKRDKYTCVECGFKARQEKIILKEDRKYYDEEYTIFKIISKDKDDLKVLLGDGSQLIADHIIPIAIGGEEYDLDNVQTLCIKCNKIKTKKDIKKITLYRKQPKFQTKLQDKT